MFLKFSVERSHLVSTGPEEASWASRQVLINTTNIVTATLRSESNDRKSLIIQTTDGSIHTFPCTTDTMRVWQWMENQSLSEGRLFARAGIGA